MEIYVRYSDKTVTQTLADTRAGIRVDLDEARELVGVQLVDAIAVTVDGKNVTAAGEAA